MVGGGSGKKTTFRWIDGVRYALALVVTVVIFTVIGYAVKLVLRPAPLTLFVTGGAVSVERNPELNQSMIFHFKLHAVNPSGRVRMYYTGVTAKLAGKLAPPTASNTTTTSQQQPPAITSTMYFLRAKLEDMTVTQVSTLDSYVSVHASRKKAFRDPPYTPYFDMFYYNDGNGSSGGGGVMHDAVLMINGSFITEVYSGHNNTAVRAVYCCSSLTVAVESSSDDAPARDVLCTQQKIKLASLDTNTICL